MFLKLIYKLNIITEAEYNECLMDSAMEDDEDGATPFLCFVYVVGIFALLVAYNALCSVYPDLPLR